MSNNTIKLTNQENTGDILLVVKKKKFPWWILLLLLPLVLLIPVPRDIRVQFLEYGSGIAVSKSAASIEYPQVSTFGQKTPITVSDTTDTEGKMIISDIKEPLWYRLFGGASDSLFATCGNGCQSLSHAGYSYPDFKPGIFRELSLSAVTSVETLKVVDADDGQPLPGASVDIVTTVGGNSTQSQSETDPAGQFEISQMPVCGQVRIIASREGYLSDTLEASLFDINNMTENEKTLHLVPIKGSVKVIVRNLKTKTLLPDALVTLTINGASQTLRTNTNGVGVGVFDSLRVNSNTLAFKAQKSGYADTTLEGYTVAEFMALDEEKRTMYLRPLTQSLLFINTDGRNVLDGVKNEIYKNGKLIATEYSNSRGEFVVNNVGQGDKISIVASKSGYLPNGSKVKNKTLQELNTQESRTIPLTKKQDPPAPTPPPSNKQDDLKGESGDLRINLQWYCKTDLDLHVIDPCGNEIYFSKRKATCQGGTGILDLDANALFGTTMRPQENIYWLKPTPGVYTVKVVCFKWRERTQLPISYNVSIVDKNGRKDKRGLIANGQNVIVIKHTVTN
ncbi:MAG: carboxypeptidase regulatory-like domain-containing protein [Bacteroidales bacterium]|nr:carboxypeptidase regulatory-like domain-containing protein [Bacteroidales bacterium]